MPALRHAGAPGEVHEPVVVQLSEMPASAEAGALVRDPGGDSDGAAVDPVDAGDGLSAGIAGRRDPAAGADDGLGAGVAGQGGAPADTDDGVSVGAADLDGAAAGAGGGVGAGAAGLDGAAGAGGGVGAGAAGLDGAAGVGAGAGDGVAASAADDQARLTAWVQGRVQGVGFRWWVRSSGLELGLVGMAENLIDGRVKVVVEGSRGNCAALLDRLGGAGAPGRVARVTFRWDQARGGLAGFVER